MVTPFPFGVSHCTAFQGCACLIYPISNFRKIFTIFLRIILEYNVSNNFFLNYFISFYKGRLEYICENECSVTMHSKTQIYSKKNLINF
jgi:hypothetical protein